MKTQKKILTVPNLMSAFRLVLIPVFVWLYCWKKDYIMTGAVLILSGITDLADGYVARHFNAVSDLGKILDPVADKLTQAAMLICLVIRFPLMAIPLILLVIKEIVMGITGVIRIKKTGEVHGAEMHGKIATTLLDLLMIIHTFWFNIPKSVSDLMIAVCVIMMGISFLLYCVHNVKAILGA